MRLATVRTGRGTRAAVVRDDVVIDLDANSVDELLAIEGWRALAEEAAGPHRPIDEVDFAPLVSRTATVVCVGLNYVSHILELGQETPRHPTLFAKLSSVLIGAGDEITLPAVSDAMDWEAELAVIIGRRVGPSDDPAETADAIAGWSVLNDVTARDLQRRTSQWFQGKNCDASTPVGPWMVTADEVDPADGLRIVCEIDGQIRQEARTDDLLFTPAALVTYVSRFLTLHPGDVISTGTPGGVGTGMIPPEYLDDGSVVRTAIEGIGECLNRCVRQQLSHDSQPDTPGLTVT